MSRQPAFFIQVRLSSTRLSNKVLRPIIHERSILDVLLERINFLFPDKKVYVLTTTNGNDDPLVEYLKKKNITVFRGSEENVLSRFIEAAEQIGESDLIRVCSDNPFLLPKYLSILINHRQPGDYLSFSFKGVAVMKCHFGFFAERVSLNALKKTAQLTNDLKYLEHVTNFIYSNPQMFTVTLLDVTRELNDVEQYRLTVDTKEDFSNASEILSQIKDINSINIEDIIKIVEKRPELYQKMINQKIKNSK